MEKDPNLERLLRSAETHEMEVARLTKRAAQAGLSATAMAKQANRFKRERDEARAKVERLARLVLTTMDTLPVCNREYIYEAFCGRLKGHAGVCDGGTFGSELINAARAALEDK